MKFLNYGSVNIDLVFTVDHVVQPGETLSSSAFFRSAGGKGANQSAALAKAGANVTHAGKIGSDGQFLVDLLRGYGVDTSLIRVYEGATGQALIQLDKHKQNAIVLFGGGNLQITRDEIDTSLERFDAGDMLVLQNEIVYTAYLMESANRRGMKICLNTAPFDEKILSLPLHLADILVVNEIEGAALANTAKGASFIEVLDALVKKYPSSEIVLTVGKYGAYYAYKETRLHEPIYDLPVADTTAAGDTFIGYFLTSRSLGHSNAQALRYACKASALAVSRIGAMGSIPVASEVFD
ncbi:MAG TPA: ribokinase [Sphaerochaeta sp.]|nr:ribokinase [Sphaerochaeta sp.]